jgi:hypothetical protein
MHLAYHVVGELHGKGAGLQFPANALLTDDTAEAVTWENFSGGAVCGLDAQTAWSKGRGVYSRKGFWQKH